MVIEASRFVIEIVGANNGGVSACITAAEPALFQHGDILDTVFFGQVIGCPEAMAAGTDDDYIILLFWLWIAPLLAPTFMATQGLADQIESVETFHKTAFWL